MNRSLTSWIPGVNKRENSVVLGLRNSPRDLVKKLIQMGLKCLMGFLTAIWNTLRNVKWKFLGYAVVYVIVLWGSELLLANPGSIVIVISIGLVWLAIGIAIALKRKAWLKNYTTLLTWFAIIFGSITADQLSRITISLARFVQFDWRVLFGVGLFVVQIAMVFWFVEIFARGAFVVDASAKKR